MGCPGLGKGGRGELGLMAIDVSIYGPLCWASGSQTGPTTRAKGTTKATGPFAGVSRSSKGAGVDAGSWYQGAKVLTNLSRFEAQELLTTSKRKTYITYLTRAKG